MEARDLGEDAAYLVDAENGRQSSLVLGFDQRQRPPVAVQHLHVEVAQGTVSVAHTGGGKFVLGFSMDQILSNFVFGDQIGGFIAEIGYNSDLSYIGEAGVLAHAVEDQRIAHPFTEFRLVISDF